MRRRRFARFLRFVALVVLASLAWVAVAESASAAPGPAPQAPAVPAPVVPAPLKPAGGTKVTPAPAKWGDFSDPPLDSVVAPVLPAEVKKPTGYVAGKSKLAARTATANVFVNPDSSYTAVQSTGVVNADDGTGKLVPVDATLVGASAADLSVAAKAGGSALKAKVKAKAHPLRPVFGSTAADGTVAVSSNGVSMKVTPVAAPAASVAEVSAVKKVVRYPKAAGGSDVTYTLDGSSVKETVVVASAPGDTGAAAWSFWLDVQGATPVLSQDPDTPGAVEMVKPDGSTALGMPVPYVFDSSAVPGEREAADANGVFSLEQVGARWKLTVTVDRGWLNDPVRVYPVSVDPTTGGTGWDNSMSIKSDGVTVQGGYVREGSPNDNGKIWRGFAHFPYEQWFSHGYQVIGVDTNIVRAGGTANGYASAEYWASSLTFNGALGAGAAYVNYFADNAWLGDGGIVAMMRSDFTTNTGGRWFSFTGIESPGAYTYKLVNAAMYITFNRPPGAPSVVSPANGATQQSVQTVLTAGAAADPDGDAVYYTYRVSTNPNPDSAPAWDSGWVSSTTVQVPSNLLASNTTYYWHVYAKDYCGWQNNPCGYGGQQWWPVSATWSFTTNAPPAAVTQASALPAPGTVASVTPTLSVAPSAGDPDSGPGPVRYWFSVATGADGKSGTVVSSGWLDAPAGGARPTWTVPPGYLKDGVTYSWRAWAGDLIDRDQGVWSNMLKIDTRIGDPKTSPTDSLGAATVNLANGNLVYSASSPAASFAKNSAGFTFTYNSQAAANLNGLTATYYQDTDANHAINTGDPQLLQRVEPTIDNSWPDGTSPYPGVIPNDNFLISYAGKITVPTTGDYLFGGNVDDSLTVTVNGATAFKADANTNQQMLFQPDKPIHLIAGTAVPFTATYDEISYNAYLTINVKPVGDQTNGTILPTTWLTPNDAPALPSGWTLSTDVDSSTMYTRAAVADQTITLFDDSGSPHPWTKTTDPVTLAVAWAPPDGEHGTMSIAPSGASNAGQITVTDEDGSLSTFATDGSLLSYQPVDVTGAGTALLYTWAGSPGRLTQVTDPVSTLAVSLTYGPDPACTAGLAASLTTGFAATAPSGKLCRITYPDASASVLLYTSGAVDGQLARMVDYGVEPSGITPAPEVTDFAYDANGRLAKVRDPLAYDAVAAGQAANDDTSTTLIAYTGNGRTTSLTGPTPASGGARPAHRYSYTSQPTSNPDGSTATDGVTAVNVDGLTPAVGYSAQVTFNNRYQATGSRDGAGKLSTTQYNAKDQLQMSVDPAGRVSTTTYDYADRPTAGYGPAPASCYSGLVPNGSCTGTDAVPTTTTAYDEGLSGLHVDWFNNRDLAGAAAAKTLGLGGSSPTAAGWGTAAPTAGVNADSFSFRATGWLTFPSAGQYTFALTVTGTVRVWVNSTLLGVYSQGTSPMGGPTFYVPAQPAGPVPVRIEYSDDTTQTTAAVGLTWQKPGDSGQVAIPAGSVVPGYGLATTQTTADSGGAAPSQSSTTSYGAQPWLGLPDSVTQADGGAGLTTRYSYDSLKRRTGRALPAGSITDPAKRYTDTYYANTETVTNPCVAGSPAVNQAGRAKTNVGPTNSSGTQLSTETVYDLSGRPVATRTNTDPWSCLTYDARGRVLTSTSPATADDPATAGVNEATPARTVTYTYAVGGNPLVTSVGDANGTITTTTDLLGRVTGYTDAQGVVTTSTYNQASQLLTDTATAPGGGSSALAYTYTDAGATATIKLDGVTQSTSTYDSSGELSGVAYANSTTGTIGKDTRGRLTSLTWGLSGRTVTSTVTRSQSGRVLTDVATDSTSPAAGSAWTYVYDTPGRLTSGTLSGAGTRPAVATAYGFTGTASGPCPTGTSAGQAANTNRNTSSTTVGTGAPAASGYCYDAADRLLAVTGTNAATYGYDPHGNTTSSTTTTSGNGTYAGTTVFIYDSADRNTGIAAPNGAGGTASVTYKRDATNRIITRTVSGSTVAAENGTYQYGYTAGGDSPDLDLTTSKAIANRTLVLPGGVATCKSYADATKTRWFYPNVHGDNIATVLPAGTITGPIAVYDPYGNPIANTGLFDKNAIPDTGPGGYDDAWLGQHQRGNEHTTGLNYTQMGARLYDPRIGRFTAVDPIEGGSANDYDYTSQDPLNAFDLDGKRRCSWWSLRLNCSQTGRSLVRLFTDLGIIRKVNYTKGVGTKGAYYAKLAHLRARSGPRTNSGNKNTMNYRPGGGYAAGLRDIQYFAGSSYLRPGADGQRYGKSNGFSFSLYLDQSSNYQSWAVQIKADGVSYKFRYY